MRHRHTKGAATDRVDLKPPASHSNSTKSRRRPRCRRGRFSETRRNVLAGHPAGSCGRSTSPSHALVARSAGTAAFPRSGDRAGSRGKDAPRPTPSRQNDFPGRSASAGVKSAVDSLLEGDRFEPSVPRKNFFGRPSIPAQFTFRNINRLACDRDRWFEFISLQRGVSCEPDSRRNLARAGSPFHRQGLLRRQEIRLAAVTTRHLRSPAIDQLRRLLASGADIDSGLITQVGGKAGPGRREIDVDALLVPRLGRRVHPLRRTGNSGVIRQSHQDFRPSWSSLSNSRRRISVDRSDL